MLIASLPLIQVNAEINQFHSPETAAWGGWIRSESVTVFAQWDTMSPLVGGISNYTPDNGQFGVLQPNTALGADLRVVPFTAGLTGTANYYSPFNVADFDVAIFTNAAHQAYTGSITIAVQVAILGTEIDDSQMNLNCVVSHADDDSNPATNSFNDDGDPTQTDEPLSQTSCIPFSQKIVLETGTSQGPDGQDGLDNEYLYLWELAAPLSVYTFDITSIGTSLSLDALSIDIGPSPAATEANVPLPMPLYPILAMALTWISIKFQKDK